MSAAVREFERRLLRLKQATGMLTDQEIAKALETTPVAFSARKVRGSFPEDKLYALAAKRPELQLDVQFILTGEPSFPVADLARRLLAAAPSVASRLTSVVLRVSRFDGEFESTEPLERELRAITDDAYRVLYALEQLGLVPREPTTPTGAESPQ